MTCSESSAAPTLEAALDELGLPGVTDTLRIQTATDTRVWRVRHSGRFMAIRVLRPEQYQVMQRELNAMRHARKHGIPAPEVIATGMVDERHPAMALSWMPGEPATDVILRDCRLAARLGKSAGSFMARMHRLPVPDEEVVPGHTPVIPREEDSPRRPSLLHLDFHPFNLMAKGSRVSAVLDWTNATWGDPRADIARSVSLLRVVAPAFVGRRGAKRMALGQFTRGFLAGYTERAGPLQGMTPYYAWAGEVLLHNLVPKLDRLPVDDPDLLHRRIEEWSAQFQQR